MKDDQDLGLEKVEDPRMILVDYGGPNVAKPLHVGHLALRDHRRKCEAYCEKDGA